MKFLLRFNFLVRSESSGAPDRDRLRPYAVIEVGPIW